MIPSLTHTVKGTNKETGKGFRTAKEKQAGRTQDFYGSETTLYDTIMVDTCHYTFQTHRLYIKSELKHKFRTLSAYVYESRFISYSKQYLSCEGC